MMSFSPCGPPDLHFYGNPQPDVHSVLSSLSEALSPVRPSLLDQVDTFLQNRGRVPAAAVHRATTLEPTHNDFLDHEVCIDLNLAPVRLRQSDPCSTLSAPQLSGHLYRSETPFEATYSPFGSQPGPAAEKAPKKEPFTSFFKQPLTLTDSSAPDSPLLASMEGRGSLGPHAAPLPYLKPRALLPRPLSRGPSAAPGHPEPLFGFRPETPYENLDGGFGPIEPFVAGAQGPVAPLSSASAAAAASATGAAPRKGTAVFIPLLGKPRSRGRARRGQGRRRGAGNCSSATRGEEGADGGLDVNDGAGGGSGARDASTDYLSDSEALDRGFGRLSLSLSGEAGEGAGQARKAPPPAAPAPAPGKEGTAAKAAGGRNGRGRSWRRRETSGTKNKPGPAPSPNAAS